MRLANGLPPNSIFHSLVKEVPIAVARQKCACCVDDCASTQRSLHVDIPSQHIYLARFLSDITYTPRIEDTQPLSTHISFDTRILPNPIYRTISAMTSEALHT